MALQEGTTAPGFNMPGDGGDTLDLSKLQGRNVVLYFYPRDMTPGCTTEARDFTALRDKFDAANAVVIGVSKDSVARHDKFRDKHDLKVRLGADEDGTVLDAYDVWKEKKLYGRTFLGIVRTTYLIDAQGIIRQVWPKVRVKGHAEEVLLALEAL